MLLAVFDFRDSSPICNLTIRGLKPRSRAYPPDEDMSLGACLKRRRIDLGWTQREVASFLGATVETYRNYEWNCSKPQIRLKQKIVKFLKKNYWDDGTSSLANRCLSYRCEEGLKIKEMSVLVGVDESVISRVERKLGISRISLRRVGAFLEKNIAQIKAKEIN